MIETKGVRHVRKPHFWPDGHGGFLPYGAPIPPDHPMHDTAPEDTYHHVMSQEDLERLFGRLIHRAGPDPFVEVYKKPGQQEGTIVVVHLYDQKDPDKVIPWGQLSSTTALNLSRDIEDAANDAERWDEASPEEREEEFGELDPEDWASYGIKQYTKDGGYWKVGFDQSGDVRIQHGDYDANSRFVSDERADMDLGNQDAHDFATALDEGYDALFNIESGMHDDDPEEPQDDEEEELEPGEVDDDGRDADGNAMAFDPNANTLDLSDDSGGSIRLNPAQAQELVHAGADMHNTDTTDGYSYGEDSSGFELSYDESTDQVMLYGRRPTDGGIDFENYMVWSSYEMWEHFLARLEEGVGHFFAEGKAARVAEETKAAFRYVRTPEGAAHYGQAIGSIIHADLPEIRLNPPGPDDNFEILPEDERGRSGDGRWPGTNRWGIYGSAGVILRTAGQVLLVQRGPGISRSGIWQLPGGAKDEDETAAQGVAREMREETGFTAQHWMKPLGSYTYRHESGWTYTTLAADIDPSAVMSWYPVVDGQETSAAKWFTRQKIEQMIERGELDKDLAKTILPLLDQMDEQNFQSSRDSVAAGDFRGLKLVEGQKGTHDGGLYEAHDGTQWYIKSADSPAHAANEVLASKLYRELEVRAARMVMGQQGKGVPELGEHQVASEWIRYSDRFHPDMLSNESEERYLRTRMREDIIAGFAADVWLANWDVAGMGFSNLVKTDQGHIYRVDQGGALAFRAMGTPKGDLFGPDAVEWQTLRDPLRSPDGSRLFANMNLEELRQAAARLDRLVPSDIRQILKEEGFDDAAAELLIARKEDVERRLNAEIEAQKLIKPTSRADQDFEAQVAAAAKMDDALQAVPIKHMYRESYKLIADLDERNDAQRAVGFYAANEYKYINNMLRTGRVAGWALNRNPEDQAKTWDLYRSHILGIDAAMDVSVLDRDVVVYRGVSWNEGGTGPEADRSGEGPFGKLEDAPEDMTGFTWHDPGYTSTSVDRSVSEMFSTEVGNPGILMRIVVPKGMHGIQLSGLNDGANEGELLLQSGLTFRVVKDHGEEAPRSRYAKHGMRIWDVELVLGE